MEFVRREVLLGTPAAAAGGVLAAADAIPRNYAPDVARLSRALGVSEDIVRGLLSRVGDRLPAFGAACGSVGPDLGLGCDYASLDSAARGTWRFRDPAGWSLSGAVGLLCPTAAMRAPGGIQLRWLSGCAFGGVTLLLYRAPRMGLGLILPGQIYGRPPARLLMEGRG